jgi:hypothetical protein
VPISDIASAGGRHGGDWDATPTPAALLRAWDALRPTTRGELYAYVKQGYGQRVLALLAAEVVEVLEWITGRDLATATADGGEPTNDE